MKKRAGMTHFLKDYHKTYTVAIALRGGEFKQEYDSSFVPIQSAP